MEASDAATPAASPTIRTDPVRNLLVAQVASVRVAIPLGAVLEVMRPLPILDVGSGPGFLSGIARVRGDSVTVLDLAALLFGGEVPPATRWLLVQAPTRRTVLAVTAVLGIERWPEAGFCALSPLMEAVVPGSVDGLSVPGQRELRLLLDPARVLASLPAAPNDPEATR